MLAFIKKTVIFVLFVVGLTYIYGFLCGIFGWGQTPSAILDQTVSKLTDN